MIGKGGRHEKKSPVFWISHRPVLLLLRTCIDDPNATCTNTAVERRCLGQRSSGHPTSDPHKESDGENESCNVVEEHSAHAYVRKAVNDDRA